MFSDRVSYRMEGNTLEISIRVKPRWWALALAALFLWPWFRGGLFLFTNLLRSRHPVALSLALFFFLFFLIFLGPILRWALWNFFCREVAAVSPKQLVLKKELFGFGFKRRIFPVKHISKLALAEDPFRRSPRPPAFLQGIFLALGLAGGIVFKHKREKHWFGLFSLSVEETREVFTRLRPYLPEEAFAGRGMGA